MDGLGARVSRRGRKPSATTTPVVQATKGWELFKAIWFGPDSATRKRCADTFGSSNCSAWAYRRRKPEGDARVKLQVVTGIAQEAWADEIEGET
jgi:hypothetical protein